MTYDIISTGSKGNAVVVNGNVLIDCGVPFKALREHYKNLQLILLSHIHGDHFNRTAIGRLAQERPTLRFGCCGWLVAPLLECGVNKYNIDVYMPGGQFIYPGFCTVEVSGTTHNVPNCAYHLQIGAERLLYATDTNTMDGIDAKHYDLYMLEANYAEQEIIERIRQKQSEGKYCHEWGALENHLSQEKALDWLYENMGPNSGYIFMHQHED